MCFWADGLRQRAARAAGDTKYPLSKLIKLAADGITNFSTKPLSIIISFGMITSLLSFTLLAFFLIHRLFNFELFGYTPKDVPGFTSIILAILMVGGVQLLSLGVIGEYIGRIFEEVKARPPYIAKEKIGIDNSTPSRIVSTSNEQLSRKYTA